MHFSCIFLESVALSVIVLDAAPQHWYIREAGGGQNGARNWWIRLDTRWGGGMDQGQERGSFQQQWCH